MIPHGYRLVKTGLYIYKYVCVCIYIAYNVINLMKIKNCKFNSHLAEVLLYSLKL